jgi:deoxycytidylate deaminase
VVCETTTRQQRLRDHKCREAGADQIEALMRRDEDEDLKHGQKVAGTFHRADFFVDNTPPRFTEGHFENKEWVVNEKLGRLLDILSGTKIVRPQPSESGMFHAEAAKLRSACLSRQVGAAITDQAGNVIATGTNEVPMAGGGVYGSNFAAECGGSVPDYRCSVKNQYCSNNRVQDEIMQEVIETIPALKAQSDIKALKAQLKKTALGRLLEFSRAVHAEMDALLSAARTGSSTVGAKIFVTTFPCHYCARHLVAAGIDEVQFIEPYPKSRALDLHSDAIEQSLTKWNLARVDASGKVLSRPGKVLFRPFTGVAPRFYKRAFLKDRDYKGGTGEMEIQEANWETGLLKESYLQVETKLSEAENG